MDSRSEIRDFLTTWRAGLTPEQAGLPACRGDRRVAGTLRVCLAGRRVSASSAGAHQRHR